MKRLKFYIALGLFVGLGATALAKDETTSSPTPEQFAYGIEITLTANESPIQTMLLPEVVYRSVTRSDLSDIRVFDSEGIEVAFAIRSLAGAAGESSSIELPHFPVLAEAGVPLRSVNLRVEHGEDGQWVEVRTTDGSEPQNSELRAFLVDTSPVSSTINRVEALRFTWAESDVSFVSPIVVERSADLSNWSNVSYNASLAHLRFEERVLERMELPVNLRSGDTFLRIVWPGATAPPIGSVSAVLRPVNPEPKRRSIGRAASSDEPHVFDFDLGGPVPVDRLTLTGLQPGTVAEVQLASRAKQDDPWQPKRGGLLYSIEEEGVLFESPPFEVSARGHRYWRITVDPKGGGLGSAAPTLEGAWVPEQLLFMKRGKPPYLLAFGSAQASPADFDARELLSVLPEKKRLELPDSTVIAGGRLTLGGVDALRPHPKEPWKTYLLWTVLIAGVLLLVSLSVRLVTQLNRDA